MKTNKKFFATLLTTGVGIVSFAQVNLGLQSTSQAVVNATSAVTATTQAASAASRVASTTVNTTVNQVARATQQVSTAVQSTTQQPAENTAKASGDLQKNSSLQAGASVSASATTAVNNGAAANGNTQSSASVSPDGDQLTRQAENVRSSTTSTAQSAKTKLVSGLESDVKAIDKRANAVRPGLDGKIHSDASTSSRVTLVSK